MSLNKFAAGTVLATPAIGGGSYVVYEELTKEETNTNSPTEQTENSQRAPDNATNREAQTELPGTEKNEAAPTKQVIEAEAGSHTSGDVETGSPGKTAPVPPSGEDQTSDTQSRSDTAGQEGDVIQTEVTRQSTETEGAANLSGSSSSSGVGG